MKLFRRHKRAERQAESLLPRDEKPRGEVAPSPAHKEEKPKGAVRKVLSGDVLYNPRTARYYPFLLYCTLLILLYMGFVFQGQRVQREEIECRIELQRIRARSLIYSSERIEATRHSNIQNEITKRGIKIKEWPTPPHIITNEQKKQTK